MHERQLRNRCWETIQISIDINVSRIAHGFEFKSDMEEVCSRENSLEISRKCHEKYSRIESHVWREDGTLQ